MDVQNIVKMKNSLDILGQELENSHLEVPSNVVAVFTSRRKAV
jgi:hypothetical protein